MREAEARRQHAMPSLPPWTPIGVGSLPGTDARAAVEWVLRTFPDLPHWPQLPALSAHEGMLWQFLPRLPAAALGMPGSGWTGLSQDELGTWLRGELTGLQTPMDGAPGLQALERALDSSSSRRPPGVKGQSPAP